MTKEVIFHNAVVAAKARSQYRMSDLDEISALLDKYGSLHFPVLDNGLFSAATLQANNDYTGYSAVWVRDNIHIAHAHYLLGTPADQQTAIKTIQGLAKFLSQERPAFERIIATQSAPADPMARPHIRFEGRSLSRIDQLWNHAQNDALGYFLWFFCRLIRAGHYQLSAAELTLLTLLPLYFQAVKYWQDEDSGHWEEDPKIEASSIGAVVAGLEMMRDLWHEQPALMAQMPPYRTASGQTRTVTLAMLEAAIAPGRSALNTILPWESIQPGKSRRYDAALLFLVYPLRVVTDAQAEQITGDVTQHLQGKYGISRYRDDSFWCRDYRDIPENIRTSIQRDREAWFTAHNRALKPGQEAQWCLFDPILSAIYGLQYQQHPSPYGTGRHLLDQQTYYFNRALGHLTSENFDLGGFKAPELYTLQNGQYIPNDATPLLWTQANLWVALKLMKQSLQVTPS